MKTNDYLLLAATAAYSYLFYEQTAGINVLLFNIVFIILLIVRNRQVLQYKTWWWAAAMCLASSTGVVLHSSALSVFANICSLLLLSASAVNPVTSTIFSWLFGWYSILSSLVFMIIDTVNRSQKKPDGEQRPGKGQRIIAVLIVVILGVLFFVMYQRSNPLFAENTKWINLDFISFSWIMFTFGGLLLVYGLLYHRSISPIERWENRLPLQNKKAADDERSVKRYDTELFAGTLLFVLLNLMLLGLNVGDIQTLYFRGGLPKGMSHSDFVHNGVGIIILSLVMATGLVMYLFRRDHSAIRRSGILKILLYAWILQNLVMLSSTWFRNQIYVHDYNFTYRRIGVYAWLALAAIGLVITFIRVRRERSNWFLVKYNFAVWFTMLAASSLVNWDLVITRYNIANKPLKDVDFHYLFSLSDANIPELMQVTREPGFALLNHQLVNYDNAESRYYSQAYTELLTYKIYGYLATRCSSWRSWDLRDDRIMTSICATPTTH